MESGHALAIVGLIVLGACSGDEPSAPAPAPSQRTSTLPPGWVAGGSSSTAYVLGLDRGNVHGGKAAGYIASVSSSPSGFASLTQSIRADAYRGRRVRWSAWVRPTKIGGGGAGLWMRVDGPGVFEGFDNMSDRPILGTSDWRQVSVVLDVPMDAIGISCGVLLAGPGDIVADDFRLDIVGPETPPTSQSSSATPSGVDSAVTTARYARLPTTGVNLDFEGLTNVALSAETIGWLKSTAIPFATVSPGGDETDLEPLEQMIGNASLVGMGEATHGTREFFLMKHRVFEFLVHQMGFTQFAIEATWPEANDVNTYVLTGRGYSAALLSRMYFWTWNTEEVFDLVRWMHDWNLTAPPEERVQFLGFDMQYPGAAMDTVQGFIARVDPGNSAFQRQRYACLGPYRNHGATAGQTDYATLPSATRAACAAGLKEVSALFTTNAAAYQAAASPALFANAQHSARVVEQWEDMTGAGSSGVLLRDRYMAENIQWLRDQAPGEKMMLWAHNYHVSNVAGAMGSYLRSAYGDGYVNVGFAFGMGSFNAIGGTGTDRTLQAFQAGLKPAGSIESAFAATSEARLLFDARLIPGGGAPAAPLAGPIPMRSIGAIYTPGDEAAYFAAQLFPDDFDLLIYLATTTPSTLLPFIP